MRDEQNRERGTDGEGPQPFRRSGSGEDYEPEGNWAAERRLDQGSGAATPGMEGVASGAGDGGFGPEGDYSGNTGNADTDIIGEVNADRDALSRDAKELGRPRPGRGTIGGSAADEPEAGSNGSTR